MMKGNIVGKKCFVKVKMYQQLYKEHLSLEKSFCSLYHHLADETTAKNAFDWICEKNKLEAMVKHLKSKAVELQKKLEDSNERCELLEFCLLELENQAEKCDGEDSVDKGVSTEDLNRVTCERNILNKCLDCHHSFPKIINSDLIDIDGKVTLITSEMESENYRLQLEETQKKLTDLTEQLDSVLQCNCKLGVGMDYVIATVNELQSLMKWTAEKAEMKADSTVIFQKLQQLERIQKDLEKTATESEEIRSRAEQDRPQSISNDDIALKKDSGNTLTDASDISDENSNEDPMVLLDNALQKIELLSSSKPSQSFEETLEEKLLIDLNTPEAVDTPAESTSPLGTSPIKHKNCESHDSLGTNISEDEGLGEESRRGDSTGPSSFVEIHDSLSNVVSLNSGLQRPLSSEIIVTDPEGHKMTQGCANEAKDQTNTLDMCLCAIGNLRESLRTKENELLKLSALQNDQKQIAELQDAIINFHKDKASLKAELNQTKKENASLKEQVLELEEAENDARLQAQKLGEKLVFLQEKDSHFQAKLGETKLTLEKCVEKLSRKETEEQELRSQMKYMDTLVQKYEDQIRTMEIVELALRKKLIEEEDECRVKEHNSKIEKLDRGTQMYELPSSNSQTCDIRDTFAEKSEKIFATSSGRNTPCSLYSTKLNSKKIVDTCVQVPDESFFKFMYTECSVQTENAVLDSQESHVDKKEIAVQSSSEVISQTHGIQESSQVVISSMECPIQDELLKRLHQLVEEDAHLQQQLHYVDQINLTLWKKLHNLEFHIGECKKRNVSEDCASDSCIDSESEFLSSRPVSREQMRDESSSTSKCASPCANRGIIACLDQSEHEIRDRLSKLEEINSSFEKELEMREKLYLAKEKKYGDWVKTEQRFIGDLKRLSDERDSLVSQADQLQKEKEELAARVLVLQTEIDRANERHRQETDQIRQEQEEVITQLRQIVDMLLTKEKDHLKQITNLKLEKSKLSSDKSESDQLKSSYVELQLELSRTRDEMRKREEDFRIRLDESRSKYVMEEARLISELEMLRNKNSHFDEMISSYKLRQNELISIVKQKESDLEHARGEYKKNMEVTEEEHRAIEAELKRQLRHMEEGTSVATRALTEERMRLEKELQENIDDLRSKEEVYKARISELESNVTHLHDELHRITSDLDSGLGSADGAYNFRREKLQNQLRELRDREVELREKLDEMEQKEAAYRETLEHADRIVASVEQGYKNKIEELEISEKNLKQRVLHLEEVESRLRGALHKERRSSDGRKPDDLVVELLEAEAREIGLKEKVQTLEQFQRSSMVKVKDLEKIREKLETQLSDKEELTIDLQKTQQELESARKSLAKLKKSESELKSSLQQTENILANTESQLRNKIRIIDEEKKGLEETIDELRAQVRELKRKLENISNEREEHRISVTMPKQMMTPSSIAAAINDPNDEPDYVDVDECCSQPPQVTVKPFLIRNENYPQKLTMDASLHLLNNKPATLPKANKCMQPKLPHPSDSYVDNARQNLEDCMLRAMAAMKSDIKKKDTSEQSAAEENDYDEVLPRPTNLRVVQQVGSDTLLVGWNYVNTSLLEGFEVYVDGQLHETVYTPDRTKALISGLNLKRPLRLSICALSRYGQMSDPTVLELPIQGKNGYKIQGNEEEDDENEDSVCESKRPYSMEW